MSPNDTIEIAGSTDKDQVVVTTSTSDGFQTTGVSLNVDWQPDPSVLIRNEVRSLFSRDSIFSGSAGAKSSSTTFITSLGLSL